MGRIQDNWQCTPAAPNCGSSFPMHYTYDYLGDLLSRTDMGGVVSYTYSYDSAARLSQMQITANNSTSNVLSGLSYNPLGQVTAATLGPAGSSMALTRAYNDRGQLLYMQNGSVYNVGSSGSPVQYYPDGNIRSLADSVNGSWTYSYDDFNRLVSAAQGGGATYTFDYDRFGNRWHENVNGSPQSSLTFDNKNHVTNGGFSYDSAGSGDMTGDSFNTYTWDAENRLLQANNGSAISSYVYDAIGWRVQKTTSAGSMQYLFDTSGHVTEELNGSTLNRAEIYLGSMHLGTYTGGNIYFSHSDLLGTERARTLSTAPGSASQTCTGLSFADGQNCTGTDTSPLHFTGLERDAESGLDQTWFRKYSSAQGRWLVPDPLGASADPGAPQTFDRYAYAANNPMNFVDPLGLQMSWNGGDCPSDDPCPEDFLGPDFTDPFFLCELYGFCPGDGPHFWGPGGRGGGAGAANSCAGPNPPVPCAKAANNPACQLVAPGGNYNTGPSAVALFQPQMANALTTAFNSLNSRGITPTINSGYRSPADQLRMRNGASGPNPAAIVSWHQVGMAVDINGTTSSYFPTIISAMQAQGMTWGGTFTHHDPPHFQLSPAGTRPSAAMVSACAAAAGGHP